MSNTPSRIDALACFEVIAQDPKARLLDVRSRAEFLPRHAAPAVNLPLGLLSPAELALCDIKPGKRVRLYCICASGIRSVQAVRRLNELGFTDVAVVDGGLRAWTARGLPTASQPGPAPAARLALGTGMAALTVGSVVVAAGYGLLATTVLGLATAVVTPWKWLRARTGDMLRAGLGGRVSRRSRGVAPG